MQPPSDPPVPPARWVSFAEAQRILGLTEGTLRRAIKSGTVQAERRHRNPDSPTDQRMVYEVLVSDAPGAAAAAAAPIEAAQSPAPATEPPEPATRSLDIFREIFRATNNVLTEANAERQRLAVENATLRERVGRAEALSESLAVERASAMLERDELREENERLKARRWWRWW